MSEKPQDWDRSRDEIISGEYVLGVLSEEDRRRVEARMARDPRFARQVRRWQTNLADFNEQHHDVRPPKEVYARLPKPFFRRVDPTEAAGFWRDLWASVAFWRVAASVALVVAVGAGLSGRASLVWPGAHSGPVVADLTGMDSPISLVATYELDSGRLSVTPSALKQDAPKSLELWLIDGKKEPVSLGVLPENGRGDVQIASVLRDAFVAGKTIAITVEPFGGSPTGKPTGAVIALGKTRTL